MRKVAVALGSIVAIGVLATPVLGGYLAKRAHNVLSENLDQVEASTLGAVRVSNEGFESGWLSSKARMRIEVGPAGASWNFPLVHIIHHGPLPVAHATRGFSLAIIDTTLDGITLADGQVPFRAETVVGMTGDLRVDLSSLALPRRQEVAWEGGTARLRMADRGKRIAVQASAPRFEFHSMSSDVVLESLQIDYNAQRSAEGPSTGMATYALGRARLQSAASQGYLSIEGLSWTSNVALNSAGKFDSAFTLRLAGLDVNDLEYRDAGFEIALRNLDVAALNALNEIGQQLTRISTNGQLPEQISNQFQVALIAQLPALLQSAPEIEVKSAHLETPDGRIDVDLHVTSAAAASGEPRDAVQIQGHLVLPLPVFAALTKRVAREISPAARQNNDTQALDLIADQLAEQFLTRGYFQEDDDGRLSSEVSYRKDELTLNGRVVNVTELVLIATGALPR